MYVAMWVYVEILHVCRCMFICFSFFFLCLVWLYYLSPNVGLSEEMKTGHCLNGFLHTHTNKQEPKQTHTHTMTTGNMKVLRQMVGWLPGHVHGRTDGRHIDRPANEHSDWLYLLQADGQMHMRHGFCFFRCCYSCGRTFTTTIVLFSYLFCCCCFFFWVLLLFCWRCVMWSRSICSKTRLHVPATTTTKMHNKNSYENNKR